MKHTIDPERLAKLASMTLLVGSHGTVADGLCAMEASAWLVGERHSDAPQCVCPVVAAAARRLNDRIADTALRTEIMRPIVVAAVGTRSTRAVETQRALVAADFACREAAPMALDARGLGEWASKLRALAPVVDVPTAVVARDLCEQARAYAADYSNAYAADAAAYAARAAAADAYSAYAYAANAYAAYAPRAAIADAYSAYAYAYADAAALAAAAAAADAAPEPMSRACAAMILRMCAVTE